MYLKFKDAYDQYLIYIENRQKNQSKRTLKERFKNKILPYFNEFNIYEIKIINYIEWQNEIEKQNYSYNYKKNLHYLMCSFFQYCIDFYNIKENVPRKTGNFKKIMNQKKEIKHTYTYKEFKKFINCFDNYIYKSFFILLYFTGIRPGEAMALKFNDLNRNYISINKTIDEHYDKETKQRIINTPKTPGSIRKVHINKFLYKILIKLKKYYMNTYINDNKKEHKNLLYNILKFFKSLFLRKNNNIKNKILKEDELFIFGGKKPLSPTTINRYKIKACIKANLKSIRLHDFRHSHATLLVNKKIPIKVVSERLGHSNTQTTLDVYVHSDNEQEKRVTRTLNFLRFNIF